MDIISTILTLLSSVSGRKTDITDLELFFGSAILSEQGPQTSVITGHWASEGKKGEKNVSKDINIMHFYCTSCIVNLALTGLEEH